MRRAAAQPVNVRGVAAYVKDLGCTAGPHREPPANGSVEWRVAPPAKAVCDRA